jgi:hypothetical protein
MQRFWWFVLAMMSSCAALARSFLFRSTIRPKTQHPCHNRVDQSRNDDNKPNVFHDPTFLTNRLPPSLCMNDPSMHGVQPLSLLNEDCAVRRHVLRSALVGTTVALCGYPVATISAASASVALEPPPVDSSFLARRVADTDTYSPPTFGMQNGSPDIYYPDWFQGTWQVASTTQAVSAPCGRALFGSNATWTAAQAEIGSTLVYDARFVSTTTTTAPPPQQSTVAWIADRSYNVQSIAQAALGRNSVMDIAVATPNRLTATFLAPQVSSDVGSSSTGSLVRVDLLTLARYQEIVDEWHFDCSEVVREVIAPVRTSGSGSNEASRPRVNAIVKEIETSSLYTFDPVRNQIACRQRSASYLVPSETNPRSIQMWQLAQGRPVDVRWYDVLYTRRP